MQIVKKAILFYKKEGLCNTFIRTAQKIGEILNHIPGNILEKIGIRYIQKKLLPHISEKDVYILISCIDWKIPLFQRPHQIAQVLAQNENNHVLFISDKARYDNFVGFFSAAPRLDVVSWRILPQLSCILSQAKNVTVFKSWPRHSELLESIPYNQLVYEYIDDISLFYYCNENMRAKHYELIRSADLTVCTARALYEDALPVARHALLSPNAGDYTFFHENKKCPMEPKLAKKVEKYSCVLGYYGCLASWFDYDLVIEVAKKRPDWCFVLVGYCFDGTVSKLQNAAIENIFLYPAQPYCKLPSFVASFDIQTIPFILNDITKATSPVKLFEYMATGKPILTSAMPECLQFDSVTNYQNERDFIAQVERLLTLRNDPSYQAIMEAEAKANTWQARVSEIIHTLQSEASRNEQEIEST